MTKPYLKDDHWCVDGTNQTHRFTQEHLAWTFLNNREARKNNVVRLNPPMREHHYTRPTVVNDNLRKVHWRLAINSFMRSFFWTTVLVFAVVSIYGLVM